MTQRGISRYGAPFTIDSKSLLRIGWVLKPLSASLQDCSSKKTSSLPGFKVRTRAALCRCQSVKTRSNGIGSTSYCGKTPHGQDVATAGRPYNNPCGYCASGQDTSISNKVVKPKSRWCEVAQSCRLDLLEVAANAGPSPVKLPQRTYCMGTPITEFPSQRASQGGCKL